MSMKKQWEDPAKKPPRPETMNTPGDFGAFTSLMKRIIHMKPPRAQVKKPRAASHAPAGA